MVEIKTFSDHMIKMLLIVYDTELSETDCENMSDIINLIYQTISKENKKRVNKIIFEDLNSEENIKKIEKINNRKKNNSDFFNLILRKMI